MSPAEPQRKLAPPGAARPLHQPGPVYHQPEPAGRAAEPERRHLRLVERPRRGPVYLRRLGLALLVASLTLLGLGLVALHALSAQDQFTLNQLQDQAASAQAAYQRLRLEVAQLEAPARIVSVAEGKLKMVQPGSVTYLPAPRPAAPGAASGPASGPSPAGASRGGTSGRGVVPAPLGDADWPAIKPYLTPRP